MYAKILRGMAAGFVATCVLSILMLSKRWVPQLDTVLALDGIARELMTKYRLPVPLAGWLWHFAIGTLWWGWFYAVVQPILPGRTPWRRGVAFGAIAACLIWLIVMPLAGAGWFGLHLSLVQPLVSLVEHLLYGAVLGVLYAHLSKEEASHTAA